MATEKTNLKDRTMQQLPEKRAKEMAKDRSSVKVLECELHKPADWAVRILYCRRSEESAF